MFSLSKRRNVLENEKANMPTGACRLRFKMHGHIVPMVAMDVRHFNHQVVSRWSYTHRRYSHNDSSSSN